jgi:hypothetical protein
MASYLQQQQQRFLADVTQVSFRPNIWETRTSPFLRAVSSCVETGLQGTPHWAVVGWVKSGEKGRRTLERAPRAKMAPRPEHSLPHPGQTNA